MELLQRIDEINRCKKVEKPSKTASSLRQSHRCWFNGQAFLTINIRMLTDCKVYFSGRVNIEQYLNTVTDINEGVKMHNKNKRNLQQNGYL